MNSLMYEHPATQENLATLRRRGVRVVEPGVGRLASKGEHGVGRLADPEQVLAAGAGVDRRAGRGRAARSAAPECS